MRRIRAEAKAQAFKRPIYESNPKRAYAVRTIFPLTKLASTGKKLCLGFGFTDRPGLPIGNHFARDASSQAMPSERHTKFDAQAFSASLSIMFRSRAARR